MGKLYNIYVVPKTDQVWISLTHEGFCTIIQNIFFLIVVYLNRTLVGEQRIFKVLYVTEG